MAFSDFPLSPVQTLSSASGSSSLDRLQQISAHTSSGKAISDKEMQEVGQQFESMLFHQLLTTMRKSIPESGLFEESSARDIYEDLFDEKIAEQVAASSQTGLGQIIAQSIKQRQEQIDPASMKTRMIPLQQSGSVCLPLDQEGPSTKPLDPKASTFYPITDKNRGYLPITNKDVSANKVSIVG